MKRLPVKKITRAGLAWEAGVEDDDFLFRHQDGDIIFEIHVDSANPVKYYLYSNKKPGCFSDQLSACMKKAAEIKKEFKK